MTLITLDMTAEDAPDSVKLSDPLASYGVRRTDTLEIVVADGTNMVDQGGGLYSYEFAEVEDIEYEYVIEVVTDGETYHMRRVVGAVESGEPPVETVRLIELAIIDQGVFTAADTVPLLSNPTGSYGVRRIDNEEVIITDGATFGTLGTGHYARGFVENEEALKYQYYAKVVLNEVTYYLGRTTEYVNSCVLAVGRYTDSEQIARQYGTDNLHKWVGVSDRDSAVDYGQRLYYFINEAEQRIDDALRGPYFTGPPFEDEIPPVIVECATLLAGVLAYESRGVVDFNPVTGGAQHRLQFQRARVDSLLKRIAMGRLKVSGGLSPNRVPTFYASPTVYSEEPYVAGENNGEA